MPTPPKRKPDSARRANRIIQQRTLLLLALLGIGTFLLLFAQLYKLQIKQHDELKTLAVRQQTLRTTVEASRGTIYDKNGGILALSSTAENVCVSPLDVAKNEQDQDLIANGLGEILGVDPSGILDDMKDTASQYKVIKKKVEQETADKVRVFISDNGIKGVFLEPTSKRYYPYSTLASQVIGFVGTDNTGLYGLEARYNSTLEGQTGLVVSTKDPAGNDMLYGYEQYYKAKNGSDIVLTLDATVQYYVEKAINEMVTATEAANGSTVIVIDVETGAVLAMASSPGYDLNDPSSIYDAAVAKLVSEKKLDLADAQLRQWRNKAINDTYEPGSTFKVLTLAAALEEGVIDKDTTFDCSGSIHVLDATIHCSNRGGHGHQTLEQTAGNSCNPAFITYGLRLGTEKFYDYMKNFGIINGSGIDLDGEALGIFAPQETSSELDLACYAFGQNFNTTPIALISAQAACINGGYLHTPYVVERVVDSDGNVLSSHDTTPVRQVVSEETSALVRQCLEYVVSSGTGRNGQVKGYRIGGKTGTADKGKTGDTILSFMCFAPADKPRYIMLLTLDTPAGEGRGGGGTVAPYASQIMSEILPYLGVEPSYSAEELLGSDTTVNYVIGMSVSDAEAKLKARGFSVKVVGDGETVTDQTPLGGAIVPNNAEIILYLGAEKSTELCIVPNVVGDSAAAANRKLTDAGLIMSVSGATGGSSASVRAISQSETPGTEVAAGTVVRVQFSDSSVTD